MPSATLNHNRLATERIPRLFVSMSIPVVMQQFVLLLNNVVDRIWIAHIPEVGQLAFTASGVCVPIIYMILALAELVGTGIAPRVGYLLGQDNRYRAEQTLGTFFLFDFLLAVIVCLLIEWQCGSLVRLFGGSDVTADLSALYLRISTPGNVLCIVTGGLAPFLLAQGRSSEAGFVLASGVVLNMLLDPLLIFGLGMGLAGAAWATTIAETTAAILAVCFVRRQGHIRLHAAKLRLEWRLIGPCLALGVTPMIMLLAETLQMAIYNQTLGRLVGDVGIGTITLILMLHDFFYFPVYGMAYGVQSVTSYNLGAGHFQRVRDNVSLLIKSTLVWSVAVWLLMMLLAGPVVRLMVGDGLLADYAVPMVRLSFVVFFVATLQFVLQSTLQAMNRARATFWLGMSRMVFLFILLIWLLPRLFPQAADTTVFLVQPVADVLIAGITIPFVYRLFNKDSIVCINKKANSSSPS